MTTRIAWCFAAICGNVALKKRAQAEEMHCNQEPKGGTPGFIGMPQKMEDQVKHRMVAVSLALLAAGPAFAQSAKTSGDAGFIDKVARDGRAEVELGQLASQKAGTPEVKAFAQRLVADHTKANEQLMSIAQGEKVSPPSAVDKEHSALRSKLEGLSGTSFDRTFVQAQIDDHKKDIQYLQKEANAVKDAKLKTFIQQTLPVMQQHLQMAQQIETQLSSSGSSIAPKR